jgi:hypothetical protein
LKVSHWISPKISIGRSNCFSWTWKENRKKFRDTRKRHNRKCLGVPLVSKRTRDGKEVRRVRLVARVNC